jgi:hypothetical protein
VGVLVKGGKLRLLEHVRMEHRPIGWLQEKAMPLVRVSPLAAGIPWRWSGAGFEVECVDRHFDGLGLIIFTRNPRGGMVVPRSVNPDAVR